eukprot:scaffold58602_cov62-Phaeocystis_antarctica.AAC.8
MRIANESGISTASWSAEPMSTPSNIACIIHAQSRSSSLHRRRAGGSVLVSVRGSSFAGDEVCGGA